MSDQENPDGSPKRKRSRIAKPFQALSLPALGRGNHQVGRNLTQITAERSDDDPFANSVAGVIKRIQLTNFMCHGNFEIDLNPRINFISGANGSGKSAIQTGIVIALGGTASKTNRSSKLEGLIKHGCSSSSVAITVSNTGKDAYQPSEYGSEIRIVRNITPSSSTYRIYNEWGKLMSNKKQELDSILLKYNIQPNNPVSVLNQDMARNFLSSNKAESKYSMFKTAIQLHDAEEIVNDINAQVAENEAQLEIKEQSRRQLDSSIQEMNKKMELSNKMKQCLEDRVQLQNELAWSEVNVHREKLAEIRNKYAEQEEIKTELQSTIDNLAKELSTKEEKIEQLQKNLNDILLENRTREENIHNIKLDYRTKKTRYDEITEEYRTISTKIKNKMSDKNSIKASLDDIEKDEAEQKTKREEAEQKVEELRQVLSENESKVQVLEQEISRTKNTISHFRDLRREKEQLLYRLKEDMSAVERQMSSLKNSDDLSVYSNWMPTLVKRIEDAVREKRFSKPPRGPLGRYIKVKQDKWTNAIENNLSGAYLSSFFVNNGKDRDELYRIMGQVIRNGKKPTVHCSQFQEQERTFISKHEAKHEQYFSMLRALSINDPVVANFLMDSRNIHQILLVDDNAVCRQLSSSENFVPRCNAIINLKADTYQEGYKYYANMHPTRSRLLQKSAAEHLRSLNEELEEKRNAIYQEKIEFERITEHCKDLQKKIDEMNGELHKSTQQRAYCKRNISELQNLAQMETPSLQSKFEELTSIEEEILQLEDCKKKLAKQQQDLSIEVKKAKELMDRSGCGDSVIQQATLGGEIENCKREVEVVKRRIQNYQNKMAEQNLKIEHLTKRLAEATSKVEQHSQTAENLSQEPTCMEWRSPQEIERELKEKLAFIEEAKRKLGKDSICFEQDFLQKNIERERFSKIIQALKNAQIRFRHMSKERKVIIEQIRDLCASVVFADFESVLRSRNYRGQLQFDHNRGRLDILMAPPDSGDNYMNTESLSGGEKSVSTVAFLMSLWSHMNLPFYSMDEYDVFMDAINRRTITGLLTSFAKDKSTRQFIFLTPLDVSLIQTGPNVAVHRVKKIM